MKSTTSFDPLQGSLRLKILELYKSATAGHIACSLSCIDMVIAACIHNRDPEDVFILSKGHAAVALYVSLHQSGEITDKELETFYKNDTVLTAHPAPQQYRSIPLATGSLGHGLPFGTGVAMADKIDGKPHSVIVLMSDGETNEGTTWEAAHFAKHNKLDNLIVMVDKNGLQGFGTTESVMGDTCSPEQWKAIGFEVHEADGHDVGGLNKLIAGLKKNRNGMPKVILAKTIKGKGVSFMEDKLEWHYIAMNDAHYKQAQDEIRNTYS